jgi:hypothetical protein
MSHTSTYEVKIKDVDLLCKNAMNMGHQVVFVDLTKEHDVHFFGSNSVKAIASIHIQGWRYPIAINSKGELLYDHFGSESNTMKRLGKLIQAYNIDLITNSIPRDKVKHFYGTMVKDTKDYVLTLEY